MIKYIAIASLTGCLALAAALWWQSGTLGTLRDDNARLTRNAAVLQGQVEQARVSADVAAARAKRSDLMNAQTSAEIEAILKIKGSCLDEALDPDLADITNGVRSQD